MMNGEQIQIEYKGDWRLTSPYGWNSTKGGNTLLMAYTDDGLIRSYRLDRMTGLNINLDDVGKDKIDDNNYEDMPTEIEKLEQTPVEQLVDGQIDIDTEDVVEQQAIEEPEIEDNKEEIIEPEIVEETEIEENKEEIE